MHKSLGFQKNLPPEIVTSNAYRGSQQNIGNPGGQGPNRFFLLCQSTVDSFPVKRLTSCCKAATTASFCFTRLPFHFVNGAIVVS